MEDSGTYIIVFEAKYSNRTFVNESDKHYAQIYLTVWAEDQPKTNQTWFPDEYIEFKNWQGKIV